MSKIVFKKKVSKNGGSFTFLFTNRNFSISPNLYDLCIYLSISLVLKMKTKYKCWEYKIITNNFYQKFRISFLERIEIILKIKCKVKFVIKLFFQISGCHFLYILLMFLEKMCLDLQIYQQHQLFDK